MAKNKISRREFLSQSALIGAVGAIGGVGSVVMSSCSGEKKSAYTPLQSEQEVYIPVLSDKAIDGQPIKAGLIGCGNRGGGAAMNFLDAANDVTIVTMADIFPDRLEALRAKMKEKKGVEIADNKIYYGFDAYKNVCEDPDIDVVIIATPSLFHPLHTKYAIECGKNVFCEKPAGIDPVGCRLMMAAVKQAQQTGRSLVTGTQRHHKRDYVASYEKVRQGYIGDIVGANVYWNQGHMTYREREKNWTDMEYMLRDFFSWNWLCGDHVIDQLVHNVDVFTWFSHLKPVSVVGMGSRLRRTTGDIYDNFSLDLEYENGIHVHAMARQIDGCANNVSETIYGTLGSWSSTDMAIRDRQGNIVWQYDKAEEEKNAQNNPYVLEHVDLINHIRAGVPVCQAETTVISTIACAMGRESAYSGKKMTWDEFMASDLSLMPEKLHLGNVPDMGKYVPPTPGTPPQPKKSKA